MGWVYRFWHEGGRRAGSGDGDGNGGEVGGGDWGVDKRGVWEGRGGGGGGGRRGGGAEVGDLAFVTGACEEILPEGGGRGRCGECMSG